MDNQELLAHAATGFASGFIVVYAIRANRGLIRLTAVIAAVAILYIAIAQGIPGLVAQAGSLLALFEDFAVFFRGAAVGQGLALVIAGRSGTRGRRSSHGGKRQPRTRKRGRGSGRTANRRNRNARAS